MSSRNDAPPIARITVAAIVGLNVLVFGALTLAGVPLLNLTGQDSASAADEVRYVPIADTTDVPANQVVRAVLEGELPGAKPAGPMWASSGSPFDKACPDRKDPAPAISYARPFRVGGQTVSVRISAYGAGQGGAALADLADRLRDCNGAGTYGTAIGPTSTAVSAWAQTSSANASSLAWNRSDVVASVTVPRTSGTGLAPFAEVVDNALLEAMDGKCLSDRVTVADIGRSPWSGRPFTGNLTPRPVVLDYPDPSASPSPVVPSGVPLVPVPGPTVFIPPLATLPPGATLPTEPAPTPPVVTPAASGAAPFSVLVEPLVPSATPSPSATVEVDEQVADPLGPGCGWAFTMQGTPNFDPVAAQEIFASEVVVAEAELKNADLEWQRFRSAYAQAYADYILQAEAFADYARAQNDYIGRAAADSYDQLLAEYDAAVAARALFFSEQSDARLFYDTALRDCAAVGLPTASPSPTVEPTETTEPTPEITPTAEAPLVCPPEVPTILNELPPEVPPKPKRP